MAEPKSVPIAVALVIMEQGKVAIAWNKKWEAFVLPMTKPDAGPPRETAEQAAVRAAAEVFQLPCRTISGKSGKAMRNLQLSNRDGEIKDYHFTIVPVEVHPDFQSVTVNGCSALFTSTEKLHAGEYQPQSPSVKLILDACLEWGWL
jgi:hypothetical protein